MGAANSRRRSRQSKDWGAGQVIQEGPAPGATAVPPGFELVKEGGDGDCLFHGLARQALGDTKLASRARREVCEWMGEHLLPSKLQAGSSVLSAAHREMILEQRGELAASDDTEVLQYVRQMSGKGVWGTGLEALSAAYLYQRPLHIWSPDGYSELRPASSPSSNGSVGEPIYLVHNGNNHWDSLRQLPGAAAVGGGRTPPTEQEKQQEAVALSRVLGLIKSLPTLEQDERAKRRAAMAAAAEAREQKGSNRGLGAGAASAGGASGAFVAKPGRSAAVAKGAVAAAAAKPQPQQPSQSAPDAAAAVTVADDERDDASSRRREACLAALSRVGLSQSEAWEALAAADGDVEKVKALYKIDWDEESTVQTPYK